MILLINNSSKLHDPLSYIKQLRKSLTIQNIPFIETNEIDYTIIKKYKNKIIGILLSGSSLSLLKDPLECYNRNIYYIQRLSCPVLGICFGFQILSMLYGSKITHLKLCMDDVPIITAKDNILFKDKIKKLFFCFNDFPILPKDPSITPIAWIDINNNSPLPISYIFDSSRGIFGILGHPEMNYETINIYMNFYKYCIRKNKIN